MKNYLLFIALLFSQSMVAQNITGKVLNSKQEALIGANVYWSGTASGTTTDEFGAFELKMTLAPPQLLIATYVGYQADTLIVNNETTLDFQLIESESIDEVLIQDQQDGVIISSVNAIKTEQITQVELGKSACCDLAGCFETQITVQPQTTNVITNSKELRLLGLSGVYNQVLIDGFPMIQGLTYTYGISSVPGTLVDNIFVSKGANSVLQGYESISGQINVITKDPGNTDQLFLNAYVNSFGERHLNANYAFQKSKWSNLTAVHTVQPAGSFDRDEDQFLDLPKLTRYVIVNKTKYGKESDWGWSSSIGLRFVNENRIGGQTFFDQNTDRGSDEVYGQTVQINQPEFWSKTAYRFNDQHRIAFMTSGFYQDQESYFGTVKYDAEQFNWYANAQHEFSYGQNVLKSGISFRHLELDESIGITDDPLQRTYAGDYARTENIVGVFAENSMSFFNDKLTWIAGIRADHHNEFGTIITPRTLFKYDLTPTTILRGNIGSGWRTVNLFSENIGLLVSSRDIVFAESLEPEKAINTGVNLTQKFENKTIIGFVSMDYYRTDFQNQIFPDYDSDPTKAIIENFTDASVSNIFQAEMYMNVWRQFEFKVGYSFLDVFREVDGEKQLLPFNPRHRIVNTLGFTPKSKKYQVDMNIHWFGEQRLPDTQSNPEEFQRPDFSQDYATMNAQVTYFFGDFEIYAGCENIFNFRQLQPILSWEQPFGQFFDTSSVWGPTRGREFYLGFRFKIPNE